MKEKTKPATGAAFQQHWPIHPLAQDRVHPWAATDTPPVYLGDFGWVRPGLDEKGRNPGQLL